MTPAATTRRPRLAAPTCPGPAAIAGAIVDRIGVRGSLQCWRVERDLTSVNRNHHLVQPAPAPQHGGSEAKMGERRACNPTKAVLNVRHVTTYRYARPVEFGEHRMMMRPRDGHDQRLVASELSDRAAADAPSLALRRLRQLRGARLLFRRFDLAQGREPIHGRPNGGRFSRRRDRSARALLSLFLSARGTARHLPLDRAPVRGSGRRPRPLGASVRELPGERRRRAIS